MSDALGTALNTTVGEGRERLARSWPALLATGTVGGIDVSIGVVANLLLVHHTGSSLLGALGFTIGFISLALGNSELFTENFLVPVAAVAADDDTRWSALGRLWSGTAVMNLVGGLLVIGLALVAFPELADVVADKGAAYAERGVSWQAFASAILAGVVITVMTWMQQGSSSDGGRIVAAIAAGFLLAYGELAHVIVASVEVLGAVMTGEARYGVGEWLGQVWLWALGNAIGGMVLVTVLRLIQVGRRRLEEAKDVADVEEQERDEERGTDDRSGVPADDGDPPSAG